MDTAPLLQFKGELKNAEAADIETVRAKYREMHREVDALIKRATLLDAVIAKATNGAPGSTGNAHVSQRGRPKKINDILRGAIESTFVPFTVNEIHEIVRQEYPTRDISRKTISSGISRMIGKEVEVETKGSGLNPTTYRPKPISLL